MLDYLEDPATGRPSYIEANPRIGETVNAMLSGINLAEILVRVSLGERIPTPAPSRVGVRTHSVLMSMVAGAMAGATRQTLAAELLQGLTNRGIYCGGKDEITRPGEDPPCLIPAVVLGLQLFVRPGSVARTVQQTVADYSLNDKAVRAIRDLSG
jgi:hypothetical protein